MAPGGFETYGEKVLVSLPDDLAVRMKQMIPSKQRSKIITKILEIEIRKRENTLYQTALDVVADQALNNEMSDWEATTGDGIEIETW